MDHLRALLGPPQDVDQMQVSAWEVGVRPEYRVRWPGVEHAYRDAIPAARTAWILYPGDDFQTFHVDPNEPGRGGVGAVPLVPGGEDGAIREVLGLLAPTASDVQTASVVRRPYGL